LSADSGLKELANTLNTVATKAEVLVREEIELAKTEITEKISKLVRGLIIGVSAGIFVFFAFIYFLNAAAWGIWQLTPYSQQYWIGFAVVCGALLLLAVIAGLIAVKLVKKASPPKPEKAIEEAQKIKESIKGGTETPVIVEVETETPKEGM
jgi:uncharacterized membrane protein YqjE